MTKETTPNQALALAGKKFDAKQCAAGDVARKNRLSTRAELLAPLKPLGKPPLLPGEKVADFLHLLVDAIREHRPRTQQEWLNVWDIVMVTWQVGRLRRIDAGLFAPTIGPDDAEVSFRDFAPPKRLLDEHHTQPEPLKHVKPPRAPAHGPVTEQEMVHAFKQNIDVIERNQKLITALERRRDVLFRQLARLRAGPRSQAEEPLTLDLPSQEVE